ncbi:MAG: VWA domain-containing protein, partial [Butyricicoccus sp.]
MQKRRIVAALLSAAMMLTAAPFTAFAANADSASDGGVAVNKTASALQSRESTVTLTVGAPDGSSTVVANDPIAIEFVVDATRSLFDVDKDEKTLNDAMAAALTQLADKNVYVGLTVFTSAAQEIVEPTKLTSSNLSEVGNTITKIKEYTNVLSYPVGTNIEAGLKTAADAL